MAQSIVHETEAKIASLPGDVFGTKSSYLILLPRLIAVDPIGAIVRLGQAGERIAKGLLDYLGSDLNRNGTYDSFIKELQKLDVTESIIIGLRSIQKYRNQAAHDNRNSLTVYDFQAAFNIFISIYFQSLDIIGDQSTNVFVPISDGVTESPQGKHPISFNHQRQMIFFFVHIFTIFMLFVAVIFGGPSVFFTLLRITVFIDCLFFFLYFYRTNTVFSIICIFIALLFNPFWQVKLDRSIWKIIDFTIGAWLGMMTTIWKKKL